MTQQQRMLAAALLVLLIPASVIGGTPAKAANNAANNAHTHGRWSCWWGFPWCWPTPTPTATATPTATPKPTATNTPAPTATATPKPTSTATPKPTATPSATNTPQPTPQPTATPSGDGVVAPRDDATCAGVARATGDAREAVSGNATANQTNEWAKGVRPSWDGVDPAASYQGRVTGDFTGTTDQILAWAACKWGFPLDVVRAQASQESDWRQTLAADCGVKSQPETNGCASVGILQVKGADIPPTYRGTWPYAYESTSWNADFSFAVRRACYDGKVTWLGNGYKAGDLWGCVGEWYAGAWHTAGADDYISKVKQRLAARTWESYYR